MVHDGSSSKTPNNLKIKNELCYVYRCSDIGVCVSVCIRYTWILHNIRETLCASDNYKHVCIRTLVRARMIISEMKIRVCFCACGFCGSLEVVHDDSSSKSSNNWLMGLLSSKQRLKGPCFARYFSQTPNKFRVPNREKN